MSKDLAEKILSGTNVEPCSKCGKPSLFYIIEGMDDGRSSAQEKILCRDCIMQWIEETASEAHIKANYDLDKWFPIYSKMTLELEHRVKGPYTVWICRGSDLNRPNDITITVISYRIATNEMKTHSFAIGSFEEWMEKLQFCIAKSDLLPED